MPNILADATSTLDFTAITEAISGAADSALPAGIAIMAAILGVTLIPRIIRSFL